MSIEDYHSLSRYDLVTDTRTGIHFQLEIKFDLGVDEAWWTVFGLPLSKKYFLNDYVEKVLI